MGILIKSNFQQRRRQSIEYAELLCKSNFSFLTGASHPEELIQQAQALGLRGMALCDQNGLYGVARAYKHCRNNNEFKYIVGSEVKLQTDTGVWAYFTVLCRTRAGYAWLSRLLTRAHSGKEKGAAFLNLQEWWDELTAAPHQELVFLPRCTNPAIIQPFKDFCSDNLYLPLVLYLDGHDRKRTLELTRLSHSLDIPLVAANDVHYHVKERKIVQDVLISIREAKSLGEVGYQLFPNAERYLKSSAQMQRLFSDQAQALQNTLSIAESCRFSLSELRYQYPSEWIPAGQTAQSYLEALAQQHASSRYPQGMPDKVLAQLQHELKMIEQLNYADYFLTIYDIVQFARGQHILCQGRGSAANSVLCYILGITAIDPVQMNLLFERFISAERGEPPDIDVDFEHERREEVIQYIYQKYGRERAGMVSAVVTYQRRSAFREVCKAFGLPVGTLSAKRVQNDFMQLAKGFAEPERLQRNIESISQEMQGFPRHLSIHSGGFTLSACPVIDIVPIEPARMPGRTIIQWDKYDLDTLGLLKVDVLSLGMLSALRKTLQLVGLQLHEVPHDDPPTYEMIRRGDTVGAFQIESRAQMSMLGRLLPENFYDLVIEVAIVRPGPIVGQMVHPYLKRRRGLEKFCYASQKIENILGKTLGVPLFQEQIMKLAIEVAGFTPDEADQLRRSINAWRSSAPIAAMANRLMQGLLRSGLPPAFAKQIFTQIQGFSEYGFPESHAASFALLAYASCYLKCHHPAEFACSLINSQPMGFYRNDTIIYDAIRHGVRIRPVCVHRSQWDCTVEDGKVIRLGFNVVSGLARKDFDDLAQERERQPFANLHDFLARTHLRSDVLQRLALANRLSSSHFSEREALWAILEYQNQVGPGHGVGTEQLSLFKSEIAVMSKQNEATAFTAISDFEKIQEDYRAFSLSSHGHPMRELRRMHKNLPTAHSQTIKQAQTGAWLASAGLILVRQRPPTAKGVVFSTLEDEYGFIDLIFHSEVFEQYKETFLNHCFIIVEGIVQRDRNTSHILVKKVRPIWSTRSLHETPLPIEPTQYFY